MTKTKKLTKEPLPNKKLVEEGRMVHSIFHQGLGYRICEDDYDLQALALTTRDMREAVRRNAFQEILDFINNQRDNGNIVVQLIKLLEDKDGNV